MRKTIGILALALPIAGCAGNETVAVTTTTSTIPTTVDQVAEAMLAEAQACVKIGSSHHDPTIFNLDWVGHDMEYEPIPGPETGGIWYMDGVEIGRAEFEDEAFDACGPTLLIDKIAQFQADAIRAGAEPFPNE